MATVKLELDDEQARDTIRALSVHARDLAHPDRRDENRAEIKRLDALRHQLEKEVDAS